MRVLIAGGGVAGSVTAMALQQAGIDSTIFESYGRTDADVGSYFTISPNGLDALDAVGALHISKACGLPTRRNVLWDTRGRRLGTPGLGAPLPDGTVAQTMKRAKLTRLLLDEAVRRGIVVEFGRRLAGAAIGADGSVTASFADGSRATGDLLVGADGIHSVTRRLIDPGAPTGRYVGLTNFGGITHGASLDVEREAWHMIFGRRAFFGFYAASNGDVVWFVNWPRAEIGRDERAETSDRAWKERLIELFTDDEGPAIDLMRAGELELAGDNTYDLGHVPVWHRGPMVIIGDAAHAPSPTSGQGASMAAEDGVILAKALRDLPSIRDALVAYEQQRRGRVEKIVAFGARGSSAKVPGRFGRIMRDLFLRLVFRLFMSERSMAWLYDHRVEWDRRAAGGQARLRAASVIAQRPVDRGGRHQRPTTRPSAILTAEDELNGRADICVRRTQGDAADANTESASGHQHRAPGKRLPLDRPRDAHLTPAAKQRHLFGWDIDHGQPAWLRRVPAPDHAGHLDRRAHSQTIPPPRR